MSASTGRSYSARLCRVDDWTTPGRQTTMNIRFDFHIEIDSVYTIHVAHMCIRVHISFRLFKWIHLFDRFCSVDSSIQHDRVPAAMPLGTGKCPKDKKTIYEIGFMWKDIQKIQSLTHTHPPTHTKNKCIYIDSSKRRPQSNQMKKCTRDWFMSHT